MTDGARRRFGLLAWLLVLATVAFEGRQLWTNLRTTRDLADQASLWSEQIRQLALERDAALAATSQKVRAPAAPSLDGTTAQQVLPLLARIEDLREILARVPDVAVPEMQFLTDDDWIRVAAQTDSLRTTAEVRQALAMLRREAKRHVATILDNAFRSHQAATGRPPRETMQLASYCTPSLTPAILARYEVLPPGALRVGNSPISIRERDELTIDREFDRLAAIGPNVSDLWLRPAPR